MQTKINKRAYSNSIETKLTTVGVRSDGILEVRFKVDEYEVEIEDQVEIQQAVDRLSANGKIQYHLLVIPGKYGGISKEAREKEMFAKAPFLQQKSLAIVVRGIHQRLIGNFYLSLKKTKPAYPNKLFNSEAAAVKWILKIKQKRN